MPLPMPWDCRCVEDGFPLASIRDDDLFCQQCGGQVAWLTSPNELPDPSTANIRVNGRLFWVYASELGDGNRFTFPLEFHALDENRVRRPRPLDLVEGSCRVKRRQGSPEFQLEIVKDHHEPHRVRLRLQPDPDLVRDYGEDWSVDDDHMPPAGIFCSLKLVGNCGERDFDLLVCGEPRYEIEVRENGQPISETLPDDAEESVKHAWAISRRGPHVLTVAIRCVKGFLCFRKGRDDGPDQDLLVSLPSRGDFVIIRKTLPTGRVLGPELGPCEVVTSFNSTDWKQGELLTLTVSFAPEVLHAREVSIPLYLEPRGDLKFLPREDVYKIPMMHYGEPARSTSDRNKGVAFPHVKVFNRGDRALKLRPPVVERTTLPSIPWIEVYWLTDKTAVPNPVDLEAQDERAIGVSIDLSRVNRGNHAPYTPLEATITVEGVPNDRPPWRLRVLVESVDPLRDLEGPLAIDFGNSNTYAMVVQGDGFLPVLGDGDPENFPTAMFFAADPDGDPSRIVIGNQAVKLGEESPSGMIRGQLKRWLLDDPIEWAKRWPIAINGDLHLCEKGKLIRLYLEKIIMDCAADRRRKVTHVGLSYPTKFSPRARRRFDEIIAEIEVCRDLKCERISIQDSTPDEASAVAIGFVHDKAHYRQAIKPHLDGSPTFLVAAYDFGGGSIDSALLRFESVGGPALIEYRSEHLNFGGDEGFGGDNVTTAVAQLVAGRFDGLLVAQAIDAEFDVARGDEGDAVGKDSWDNYQHLRSLAEETKRHLCRRGPSGDFKGAGPLEVAASDFLNRVKVKARASGRGAKLDDPSSMRGPLLESLLGITLDQVYDHRVETGRVDEPPYRVRERVKDSVDELGEFVAKARAAGPESEPLFIIMAGAACRLPLVPELLGAIVAPSGGPDATSKPMGWIVGDPSKDREAQPKRKVAHGLARYLDFLGHSDRVRNLSRAGHYTHVPIAWRGSVDDIMDWVPACYLLRKREWHPLVGISLRASMAMGRKVHVYHKAHKLEHLATFNLGQAATEGGPEKEKRLPEVIDEKMPSEILLRVDGSEDKLLLRVHYGKDESGGWIKYGDWLWEADRPAGRGAGPLSDLGEAGP